MNLADGRDVVLAAAMRGARPDPVLEVDRWSEEFVVLPKDSPEPGDYRIERTPMARRILQCLSPRDPCRRVVIMGASQMLKTQIALNFIAARAHRATGNMLVLEPSDTLARRLSARITKTARAIADKHGERHPELANLFAPQRSRDSRNTLFAKDFAGGTLHIATAGSAANLAEIPAPVVVLDEVDSLVQNVQGEGDPVELAEARATAFDSSAKFLEVSSPKRADPSKIQELYDRGTREVYLVPCPHCDHHQELVIEHFHYERDPETGHMARAYFGCPECGGVIEERHKARMFRDRDLGGTAHWFARSPGDGETVSFHVSAFYAKTGSITWLRLARQHAYALEQLKRGDPNAMQVFTNTRLALPWREDAADVTTAQELQQRQLAENLPPRVIPWGALVVTITVDTQPSCLEVQTDAWGPGLETWTIDYERMHGSPTVPPEDPSSVWAKLDEYRRRPIEHAAGFKLTASVYAIDSAGANTQDVYNYGSARAHIACLIIKGSTRPDRPIMSDAPTKQDIDWHGAKVEGGALLWTIGTDTAKDHIANRLRLKSGPGAQHFGAGLPAQWFEGLLAERPVLKRTPGRVSRKRVWEKRSHSDWNAPLDLKVYALAMAHHMGLHRWSATDWQQLRDRLTRQHEAALSRARETSSAPPASEPAPVGRRMLNPGIRR